MEQYQVFALKYAGPFESSGALLMWNRDWQQVVKRNYYIWCIKGRGETIVVDAGVSPGLALKRDLHGYVSPAEVLSRIDVDANEVRHVILTHLHWDHVNGIGLFPGAAFYVQKQEYDFWTRDPIAKRPPFKAVAEQESYDLLRSLEGTPRLVLLEGDKEVLPGIECLYAPGHTVGLQVVSVNTSKGRAIVGSDCAHVFRNYREDWPSNFIVDLVAWMKTYERLRSRVSSLELLFPGHDPLMLDGYPPVAEDVTRLA